jgi:WD40 repeat protein
LTTGKELLDEGKVADPAFDDRLCRLSPDGEFLALLDPRWHQTSLKVIELARRSTVAAKAFPKEGAPDTLPSVVALAGRARRVAVGCKGQIILYEPPSRRARVLKSEGGQVADLAFDRDGSLLACASTEDGTVELWAPSRGELLAVFTTGQRLTCVALSPSGTWLAVGDDSGRIRLWDLSGIRRQLRSANLDWPAPSLPVPRTRHRSRQ